MIIPINEKYRITTDSMNWRIEKLTKRKGEDEWRPFKYYGTLESAVNRLAEIMLMESDVVGLANALEEVKRVSAELTRALTPQFKVTEAQNDNK